MVTPNIKLLLYLLKENPPIDATITTPRPLTLTDKSLLEELFKQQLSITTTEDAEDATHLIEYIIEMIDSMNKNVGEVMEEMVYMDYDICKEDEIQKLGMCLSVFLHEISYESDDEGEEEDLGGEGEGGEEVVVTPTPAVIPSSPSSPPPPAPIIAPSPAPLTDEQLKAELQRIIRDKTLTKEERMSKMANIKKLLNIPPKSSNTNTSEMDEDEDRCTLIANGGQVSTINRPKAEGLDVSIQGTLQKKNQELEALRATGAARSGVKGQLYDDSGQMSSQWEIKETSKVTVAPLSEEEILHRQRLKEMNKGLILPGQSSSASAAARHKLEVESMKGKRLGSGLSLSVKDRYQQALVEDEPHNILGYDDEPPEYRVKEKKKQPFSSSTSLSSMGSASTASSTSQWSAKMSSTMNPPASAGVRRATVEPMVQPTNSSSIKNRYAQSLVQDRPENKLGIQVEPGRRATIDPNCNRNASSIKNRYQQALVKDQPHNKLGVAEPEYRAVDKNIVEAAQSAAAPQAYVAPPMTRRTIDCVRSTAVRTPGVNTNNDHTTLSSSMTSNTSNTNNATLTTAEIDTQRRAELQQIMKDKSLTKDERRIKMEEVKAYYASLSGGHQIAAATNPEDEFDIVRESVSVKDRISNVNEEVETNAFKGKKFAGGELDVRDKGRDKGTYILLVPFI